MRKRKFDSLNGEHGGSHAPGLRSEKIPKKNKQPKVVHFQEGPKGGPTSENKTKKKEGRGRVKRTWGTVE